MNKKHIEIDAPLYDRHGEIIKNGDNLLGHKPYMGRYAVWELNGELQLGRKDRGRDPLKNYKPHKYWEIMHI